MLCTTSHKYLGEGVLIACSLDHLLLQDIQVGQSSVTTTIRNRADNSQWSFTGVYGRSVFHHVENLSANTPCVRAGSCGRLTHVAIDLPSHDDDELMMRAQLSFQLLQIATLHEVPLGFGALILVMCVVHQNRQVFEKKMIYLFYLSGSWD